MKYDSSSQSRRPRVLGTLALAARLMTSVGLTAVVAGSIQQMWPDPAYEEMGITPVRCALLAMVAGGAAVILKNWYVAMPGFLSAAVIPYLVLHPPFGDATQWIFPTPLNCRYQCSRFSARLAPGLDAGTTRQKKSFKML